MNANQIALKQVSSNQEFYFLGDRNKRYILKHQDQITLSQYICYNVETGNYESLNGEHPVTLVN